MLAHDRNDVNGNFVGFDRLSGHRGSKAMVGLVEAGGYSHALPSRGLLSLNGE